MIGEKRQDSYSGKQILLQFNDTCSSILEQWVATDFEVHFEYINEIKHLSDELQTVNDLLI